MSGFKDTFTKDAEQEELLGYDDAAFYYFASCVLGIVAVPWTLSFIRGTLFPAKADDKDVPGKSKAGATYHYCQTSTMVQKDAKAKAQEGSSRFTGWWLLQLVVLTAIWVGLYMVITQLGSDTEVKGFDPFRILEVTPSASAADIKKAYRKLSLVWHPDKNPDDPLAASRFIQITKAHAALTDETARNNYEKYGNPDGPQTSKVGIGLPRFLLMKENHLMILAMFFFFLLFFIPMLAICYYQRTKNYAANGVMIETLQFLEYYINESTRVKNCPELLAASAESRNMPTRLDDEKAMKALAAQVTEHKKRQWPNHPAITKNSYLLWAHMQRLHHLMTPELRQDCDQLLKHSVKITQAMIELACFRDWFFTAQSMIEFRRSLIQAMDVKSSQLLQIPHFDEEILRHCHRGKNAVSTLENFVGKDPEQRKGLAKMEPQQLADIEAFVAHMSDMEVKAIVEVEDEEEMVVGDVATVSVLMTRKNLRNDEAAGPVHAPFFPEPKFEEWWLFLVEGATTASASASKIVAFERVRDTDKVSEQKLRFQVQKAGKRKIELHVLCDSYAGVDKKIELTYTAHDEVDVKREIFVHKEDEDLDLQPTLFQQFMGDLGGDEESEDEVEEEQPEKEEKTKSKPKSSKKGKGDAGKGGDAAPREDESKEDDDDSTKGGRDDGDDGGDASSDSSSDSD
uniref:J domain-containing protein n=1 Tax=Zooxanthella nutricula TaxID=1333877 RepID=A0A6U6V0P2_9DINO|mmetsp:Transcript_86988/g.266300  ORF Transcript_86988/g.266300 Transcript_86988/m.266300 type:complete len:683 (+) Transcript_86988:141-2189(+)|eukprot:CAMPEP_0198495462 /NCGR_PEP_ID=MMETSP1462-20131121/5221_1 /TAXON_ID=1333877 /ORGANISM="Brandtodinium nutriculum, Strain RCC3387" /LENGTH=682 /DNA_ID=CAMNT_0044224243 /DNA_START=141 /DNA_END=2189 /DNA_ORIENTATION=-